MTVLDARVEEARVEFARRPLLRPLVLSSGAIEDLTEARAEVVLRVAGREAVGRGSIYLSDLWAWPDPSLPHERRDAALRDLCGRIADGLPDLCGGQAGHPLVLGLRLHDALCGEPAGPPALARAMCASPFDAALHDAVGCALGVSAFRLYAADFPCPEADPLFECGSAAAAIRAMIRPAPLREMPAWLIVGKDDDLERDVSPWVRGRGYRCLKLKIMGRDNARDAARTVEVFRAAVRWGARGVRLTADSNEANPDADSVLDYLQRLREADPSAFAALQYLEQPTGRDIRKDRFDWRPVTRLKPVMLDEGLTSLELLPEARAQGWSGLALKTCKGQSFALAAAAWAHERRMPVSLQDLTNPGLAMIHAAYFAAHVPTVNGAEMNSPQFTPAANEAWLPRLAGLFDVRDGRHRLPPAPPGLGSGL
jgi:L-alanine-DL-glutamate epimerase-like enolase superfamily enzyme